MRRNQGFQCVFLFIDLIFGPSDYLFKGVFKYKKKRSSLITVYEHSLPYFWNVLLEQ